MSQVFFDELDLPKPDVNLEIGSGSHAQQTALIMQRFEPVVLDYRPDWVVAPGDVNSTLACALVASKLGVKVAHVEAGLRSFDRSMPEEINRALTDHLADLLFTTEPSGNENLKREGIPEGKIRFVGNTMIDTLVRLLPKAEARWPALQRRYGLDGGYVLVTLHRPSNVDEPAALGEILGALGQISQEISAVFPVHPRTRQRIASLEADVFNMQRVNVQLIEPLGYRSARLTAAPGFPRFAGAPLPGADRLGGIQEETTYLGVPCLTVRPNTERPVTITRGTNRLVSGCAADLVAATREVLAATSAGMAAVRPALWDGRAAARVVAALDEMAG